MQRRTLFTGLSTAVLGALAGCSSLRDNTDEETSPARNWLYDQRDYTDETIQAALWFESPEELVSVEEHLHDDLHGEYVNSALEPKLDRGSVEWAVSYHNELLTTPAIRAYRGSFDATTAREATMASREPVDGGESLGAVDEYELVVYDDDWYGLYRNGEAVTVDFAPSQEVVRNLVTDRTEYSSQLADGVQQLIDCIGFETTASVSFEPMDEAGFTGTGFGYTVEDETTIARFARLNGGGSLTELRELGNSIDALSAVTVAEKESVQWLEGTIETDRTALNGTVFTALKAPYE